MDQTNHEKLPPAAQYLQNIGADFRLFVHNQEIHSLEEAAAQRGQTPEQVVRSILFRLSEHEYVMVLAAGPSQIDWKDLRRQLGVSRMTMASPEEVVQITGALPGTVSPFGLLQPVRIFIDTDIFKQAEVSFGSGERGKAILLHSTQLLTLLPQAVQIQLLKR